MDFSCAEITIKNAIINHADINFVACTATLGAEDLQQATEEICAYVRSVLRDIFQQQYDMTFEGKEGDADESKRVLEREDILWLAKEYGIEVEL